MGSISIRIMWMFNRNNRLDYQLLFGARGSFRPLGWNVLVVIVCFSAPVYIVLDNWSDPAPAAIGQISALGILLLIGSFIWPAALRQQACRPLRRALSLWSPVLAIIVLGLCILHSSTRTEYLAARWAAYAVVLFMILLLTISRMRFPVIIRLVDRALGSKQLFWRRVALNLCMVGAIAILASGFAKSISTVTILTQSSIYALMSVSLGNLRIPAAVVRVDLALQRLIQQNYYGDVNANDSCDAKKNLKPSMDIFYVMVLGQGVLYSVACVLEVFSFFPRRSLVRRAGFRGQWGVEAINLYYVYAFGKCMEGGVLAPSKISIVTFAMEYLNSESSKNQLYGVQMLHSLLQRDPARARLISKLTICTTTVARLTWMLDCTSPRDTTIRLFAAKVTYELAKSCHLRVVTIPGLFEALYGLLDSDHQLKIGNPLLLDNDEEQDERQDVVPCSGGGNLIEAEHHLTQQAHTAEWKHWIPRCCWKILECWSVPKEEAPMDQDLLPALGMSILESLTCCDHKNCAEIIRVKDIIPKVIGFTSYKSETLCTDRQQNVLIKSSLKLLHRLTSIHGEIGLALREIVSKHLFLLTNLANTLGNIQSSQDMRKSVAGILRNLAIDRTMRQEIGCMQGIITSLMDMFLSRDGSSSTNDRLLRKVAGQALSLLAMESVHNCLAMLRETRYEVVKELTTMIYEDRYRCVAASLLQNMCLHAQTELKDSDLKELSYTLREVLEKIIDAEGAELEILIGLSSQICRVIPEDFAQELELGDIKGRFVKRLADALNANKEPSAHCPGIRRAIVEQVLNMVAHDSRCAHCFSYHRMMEALVVVEETASKAENFIIFSGSGDLGLMEHAEPLSSLVAKAKQLLLAVPSVQGPSHI